MIELKRQCDELGMIKSDHSYAETTPEIIKTFIKILRATKSYFIRDFRHRKFLFLK